MTIDYQTIYKDYDFCFTDEKEFESFVKDSKCKTEEDLIKELNKRFNSLVNNKYNNRVVCRAFASKYLYSVDNVEDATDLLSYFENIITKYNLKLSRHNCILLIDSTSLVKDLIKLIYENNKDSIINGEFVSDSFLINELIDVWVEINNICVFDNVEDISNIDSVRILLSSVPRDMLTPEEIEKYGNDLLSTNEEVRKKAKDQFILHNMLLVVKIAGKFQGRGLDLEDLISCGVIGLSNACDKYDVNQGYSFNTYATWWVKQAISREVMNSGRAIRVPVHLQEYGLKLKTITQFLESRDGIIVNEERLAEVLGISVETIKIINSSLTDVNSLNKKVDANAADEAEIVDFIEDPNSGDVEDRAINSILKQEIATLLVSAKLTDKEIDIIKCRFGFVDDRVFSLTELAEKYNCTKERIRQIEGKAIAKLRRYKTTKSFACYVGNERECLERLDEYNSRLKKVTGVYDLMSDEKYEIKKAKTQVTSDELAMIDEFLYDNALMKTDLSGSAMHYYIRTKIKEIDYNPLLETFNDDEKFVFGACFINDEKRIKPNQLGDIMGLNSNVAYGIYRSVYLKIMKYLETNGYYLTTPKTNHKVRRLIKNKPTE